MAPRSPRSPRSPAVQQNQVCPGAPKRLRRRRFAVDLGQVRRVLFEQPVAPDAPYLDRYISRRNAVDLGQVVNSLSFDEPEPVCPGAPVRPQHRVRRNAVDASVNASVVRNLGEAFDAASCPRPDDINPSTGRPYSWAPLQNRIHPGLDELAELMNFRLDRLDSE
jgi:hypothetical protein